MDTVKVLQEKARTAVGYDDFGDESYLDGLGRLISSIESEADVNERGRGMAEYQIVDFLSRRLEVEHWYAKHPEIDEQEIVAPVIGLGLPRTGSTALSAMLGEDPAVRTIRAWESSTPCPPPEAATQHDDPRIAAQLVRMSYTDQIAPRLKVMLPNSPTAPTECQFYMAYDFKSQIFQASFRIPTYVTWLNEEADLVPTYQYVKRVLKLLQWRCPPNRWSLKNPAHIVFIDALDKVFPDARYWMTHRDITKVIPSVTDLYAEFSRPCTDDLDIRWIGEMNMDWTELGMHRVAAFRARGNDSRFFDVEFDEFQSDPIAVITRLYAFLGEELTDTARERMIAWRANSPRDKFGKHEIDLASLAIDLDEIRSRFSFYDSRRGRHAPAAAMAS